MTLKTISILGWICFTLDAIFVLALFASRNMGDDAAGRGMATGFAVILTPVLLAAGGVLLWGTRSGSRAGIIGGAIFAGLPFIYLAFNLVSGVAENVSRAASLSRRGKFKDKTLTRIAAAVQSGDTAQVLALLKGATLDWSQRDVFDHTLLGVAVDRASDMFAGPPHREMVRVLLENGVPYAADATKPGDDWFAALCGSSTDKDNDILEVALKHGANPNANERFDEHPLIFSSNMTLEKVKLLVKYGANVQAKSDRVDRKGWSALMNAAYMRQWDIAMYFLEQGVRASYKAPDGSDVFSVLKEVAGTIRGSGSEVGPEFERLEDSLHAAVRAEKSRH